MYEGDFRYAATRLEGTVVRRKDTPIFVDRVYDDGQVDYRTVILNKVGRCPVDDLNLIPVPLGYVNSRHYGALYVIRKPMRRDWRQGLRPLNMVVVDQPMPPELIEWPAVGATIKNKYKSFDDCRKAVEGGAKAVAWHRDWAIFPGSIIHYRGGRVGRVVDARVILDEGCEYLIEALEEAL